MFNNQKRNPLLISLVSLMTPGLVTFSLVGDAKVANSQSKDDWSYGGSTNPTQWDNLSSDFETCETGNQQSPINIKQENTYQHNLGELSLNYDVSNTNTEVVNNGHSIQVNYDSGSSLTWKNQTYELKQFHFHTPSEHQIDGEASSMELHLVHLNEQGEITVVGALIEPGTSNSELQKIWSKIPQEGEKQQLATTIDASNLLPENKDFYHYSGSLTSPPCSEGVNWIILQEPIEASKEQIDAFTEFYQMNARPIQETNNRPIFDVQQ